MQYPTAHTPAHERQAWVKAKIEERKEEVRMLFFEEGLSEEEVARRTNYSKSSVAQIVRETKLVDPKRAEARVPARYDRRLSANRTVLSGVHAKIGIHMNRFMAANKMNITEFGLAVGMTRSQVSEAQAGSYDFPLTQLQAVCRIINIDPATVFIGMHNGPISAPRS